MDVELHYREQGTGEPLILLHGNGCLLYTSDAADE